MPKTCPLTLILFVILVALFGCVFYGNEPYPKSWPEPMKAENRQCPDLTGVYNNDGICETESGTLWKDCPSETLESALYNWYAIGPKAINFTPRENVKNIEIKQPSPDSLDITLRFSATPASGKPKDLVDRRILRRGSDPLMWGGPGAIFAYTQDVNTFSCDARTLFMSQDSAGTGFTVSGHLNRVKAFSKATNGDLILKSTESLQTLLIAIPIYQRITCWCRWPQIKSLKQ